MNDPEPPNDLEERWQAEWRQVEPLFDRALDMSPETRAAFVAEVRLKSSRIAAKLEQLLEAADGAVGEVLIDQSVEEVAPDLVERIPTGRTTGYHAGVEFDGYRLVRRLGAGGSGQVFLAERVQGGARVALKLLLAAEEESLERFDREQRILASLDHPGLVPLGRRGTSPYGHPYFTMRYVEGLPLLEYFDAPDGGCGSERLRSRIDVLIGIARIVGLAHENGVVHRDLKPSNVLIEPAAEGPRPVVLDFGAARSGHVTELTMTGQVIGTLGYMSPEQARGLSGRADSRSDVFSIGVLAFELLSGQHPFRRQSPVETQAAVIHSVEPRLPGLDGHITEKTAAVIHRALAKEPAERFADGEAMAVALESV